MCTGQGLSGPVYIEHGLAANPGKQVANLGLPFPSQTLVQLQAFDWEKGGSWLATRALSQHFAYQYPRFEC